MEVAHRAFERAEKYYSEMRAGHLEHEREIRFVSAVMACAREALEVLSRQIPSSEEELLEHDEGLLRSANKIDRAIERAGGIASDPPTT